MTPEEQAAKNLKKAWDRVLEAKVMLEERTWDRTEPVEPHVELEVHTRARYTNICLKTLRGLFNVTNSTADEDVSLSDRLLGLEEWAKVNDDALAVSDRFAFDIEGKLIDNEDKAYARAIEDAAEPIMLIAATRAARRMAGTVSVAVIKEAAATRRRCQELADPDAFFQLIWTAEVVPRLHEVVMNAAAAAAEDGKPPLVLKDAAEKPIRDVARLNYRNGLRSIVWDECCRRHFLRFFNADFIKERTLEDCESRPALL